LAALVILSVCLFQGGKGFIVKAIDK